MRFRSSFIVGLCLPVVTLAQDKAKEDDPFDLSPMRKKIEELGTPTQRQVEDLEAKALELYRAEKTQRTIDALDAYARTANALGNFVKKGIQPYYNQRGTDVPRGASLAELSKIENYNNSLVRKRDRAWIMEAECYYAMGDKTKAVALLITALDHMSSQDVEWWNKARQLLYEIIQINIK